MQLKCDVNCNYAKKEDPAMKVSYNGFIGELKELVECKRIESISGQGYSVYNLEIYGNEKQVTHSFTGVNLEDVKFLGGVVVFDG